MRTTIIIFTFFFSYLRKIKIITRSCLLGLCLVVGNKDGQGIIIFIKLLIYYLLILGMKYFPLLKKTKVHPFFFLQIFLLIFFYVEGKQSKILQYEQYLFIYLFIFKMGIKV